MLRCCCNDRSRRKTWDSLRGADGYLVAEADARHAGRHHYVMGWIDAFFFPDNVFYGDRDEMWRLQCHHLAPSLILDRRHCGSAESRCEKPVVTRRHSAALQMSEYKQPAFLAGALLYVVDQLLCNRPCANCTMLHGVRRVTQCFGFRVRTLCRHYYRKIVASFVTREDLLANLLDVVRDLGNENHIGRRSEPCVERNESSVSPHHFHHDHSVVALCSCMQLVECFDCSVDGSVEAESRNGATHIIVDCLRHSDNFKATPHELQCNPQRSVSSDRNERIDAKLLHVLDELVGTVLFNDRSIFTAYGETQRISSVCRTQDCAAKVCDAAHSRAVHRHYVGLSEKSCKAVAYSHDFPSAIHRR